MLDLNERHDTNESSYSPHSLLPAPEPCTYNPPLGYFYHNVAKHLIKDTVRLMANGLHIDLDKVEQLETTLDEQLAKVQEELASNPLISEFQQIQHSKLVKEYIADRRSKMRTVDYYIKPFNYKDTTHRSYFMHLFANEYGLPQPSELVEGTSVPKWSAKLVSTFASTRPVLQRLLKGELTSHPLITEAMHLLATDKCFIYNQKYLDAIHSPNVPLPIFNPASSTQKQELFKWLGIESDKTSKTTGLPSFDRDEIERINKETTDEHVRHLTQCFIDHSFAAIVRNNFIEAFYRYTVDDRLYGTYKLFGAKTFRFTSSNPNLLNFPSSKSVFSAPIKKCFTAPEGKLIYQIDYAALEDKVFANLTKDKNKIITQTDSELDGHLFHATIYFRKQFVELLGDLPHRELAIAAKQALDGDNEELAKAVKKFRNVSKNITFGASYGAYPKKIAAQIKCSIEEATDIFNAYHNDMYPGITNYRENYVIPIAKSTGRIHMGLGCYIKTDDAERDQRTLHNSTAQFWSILTLLTINKLHLLIDKAGYENDVKIVSSIYDAIYIEVTNNPIIIKWLNDTIIPIILQNFIHDQLVPNDAEGEIGFDWYSTIKIPHNASLDEISTMLESL